MIIIEPKTMKNQGITSPSPRSERGNVMIIIFVAIALFAALSYTLSRDSRTSGTQLSDQQASLSATEILNYTRTIRDAVQQLRINGCDDNEIDFGNTVYERYDNTKIQPIGANTNAPSDGSCGVFNPNGGNIRALTFTRRAPTIIAPSIFKAGHGSSAEADVIGVGESGVNDIIFSLADIENSVCVAFNEKVGVNNPGGAPPEEDAGLVLGDVATGLTGKLTGCYFRNATSPRNFIYTVLIAR